MGAILGVGVTHYTGLIAPDAYMAGFLRRTLSSERAAPDLKDPRRWPAEMQAEWADDEGTAAAARHRERIVEAFRRVHAEIDAFRPDLMVIWGDDQYENFREDIIPPFCVYIIDSALCRPLKGTERWAQTAENVWGEPQEKAFTVKGHPAAAQYLVRRLIEGGFDIPYAYRTRYEKGLAHSFVQTLMYLDYDRTGMDYPIVPFHVNCYGTLAIRNRGVGAHQFDESGVPADPPAPSPARCFEVGRATARLLRDSPWRVVLIGSSSWSHAFLTEKNRWLYPDFASDRRRLEELTSGRFSTWATLDGEALEEAGEHEFLNWVCLAGAMTELGQRAEVIDYVETYVFNSNKCFAVFRP